MKFCSYCNCHITNMTSHQRSKKHISNVENGDTTKENITVSMKGPTLNMDKLLEQATEEDNSDSDSVEESVANYSIYSENFIQELENDKFSRHFQKNKANATRNCLENRRIKTTKTGRS